MDVRIGIDASQHITSCAISVGSQIIAHNTVDKPIENMASLIHDTLLKARIGLHDLNEIVACVGPGSNMGSRATVVTGNALSLALNIPVTGVISTDTLVVFSPYKTIQKVAVPAGRGRWYIASYDCTGDKIIRITMPELVDTIPEETDTNVIYTVKDCQEGFVCADGLLMVAGKQRQLINQSLSSEIKTFEQGALNG